MSATDPTKAPRNTTLDVRVLGSGFEPGSRAVWALHRDTTLAVTKVRTNSTTFVSSTELIANVSIAADASLELYDVVVLAAAGGKKGIGIELFEVTVEVVDLGVSGTAEAVNDQGQIVGGMGGTPSGAFLWQDGVVYDLGVLPGYTNSHAEDINESGQVVGYSINREGGCRPWVWTAAGGLVALSTLGGRCATARAINDNGDIVGDAFLPGDERLHAVMWKSGVISDLQTFQEGNSAAWDVNNAGVAVGTYWGGTGISFRWTAAGGMALIREPDVDRGNEALGINSSGLIVGWGPPIDRGPDPARRIKNHAYIWDAGVLQELGSLENPGAIFPIGSVAIGVNDAGRVIGRTGYRPNPRAQPQFVPFIWSATEGMRSLDSRRPEFNAEAHDINSNGWVVGVVLSTGRGQATLWIVP